MAGKELFSETIGAHLEAVESFPMRTRLLGVGTHTQPIGDPTLEQQQIVSSNEESSSPDDTQQHINLRTKMRRTRNLSREKMQSELKYLRVQFRNLQQQLVLLNEQKQNLLFTATWERTAREELEARIRAEMENRRLKTLLTQQVEFTQKFHQFIRNSESPSFAEPRNDVDAKRSAEIDADDVAIFESLSLELDAAYSRMEAVFNENGLSAWRVGKPIVSETQMKAWHSNSTTDSMDIEIIDSNVLPFPVGRVFSTFWECCERQGNQRGYAEHNVQDTSNTTTAIKVHVGTYFNGQHISLEYLSIAKAYVKDACINLVWRSRTKACPSFPDMYIDETGWQAMKPVTASGGDKLSSSDATMILLCTQLECKSLSRSLNVRKKTGDDQLAGHVMSIIKDDCLQVNTMMMDMLLQGSY